LEGGTTEAVTKIAAEMLSLPPETSTVTSFVDYVATELWQCLSAPSVTDIDQFHGIYIKQVHHMFLSSDERIAECVALLKVAVNSTCSLECMEWFVSDFIRKLGTKMEVIYVKSLNELYQVFCEYEDNRQLEQY